MSLCDLVICFALGWIIGELWQIKRLTKERNLWIIRQAAAICEDAALECRVSKTPLDVVDRLANRIRLLIDEHEVRW